MMTVKLDYTARLVVIFLIAKLTAFVIAIFSTFYLTPYITQTELFLGTNPPVSILDEWIRRLLAPYCRWDSLYFITISTNGYEYEHQHAFFPLLPILMNLGARIMDPIQDYLSFVTRTMLSGIIISFVSHFITMVNIYRLTLVLGGNEYFAFLASVFCCISPSFVFQTAVYSEALFSALVTSGLIAFYGKRKLRAAILWLLGASTRSNGVVMSGFFAYDILMSASSRWSFRTIASILKSVALICLTVIGYVSFQAFGYQMYCLEEESIRPWCDSAIPNLYAFVQKEYWNVGPFNYWKFSQFPNFIIASPTLAVCIFTITKYVQADQWRSLTFGLRSYKILPDDRFILKASIFPHIVLLTFMMVYSLLIVHIQIVARLFSFQPILYWAMADIYLRGEEDTRRLLLVYLLVFGLIGTLLFMNHYPPA